MKADTQFFGFPREDKHGMLFRAPGTIYDPQRGHRVCTAHQPHPVCKKLLDGALSLALQPLLVDNALVIGSGAGELCAVCDQAIALDHPKHIYHDVADHSRIARFHMGAIPDCATIYTRERDVVKTRRDRPAS